MQVTTWFYSCGCVVWASGRAVPTPEYATCLRCGYAGIEITGTLVQTINIYP